MKKRIIITVVGVITLPMDQELREKGFIEALSAELNQYFPDFEQDAKEPMVTVTVEDVLDQKKKM
jgi:hypothetical protein